MADARVRGDVMTVDRAAVSAAATGPGWELGRRRGARQWGNDQSWPPGRWVVGGAAGVGAEDAGGALGGVAGVAAVTTLTAEDEVWAAALAGSGSVANSAPWSSSTSGGEVSLRAVSA